MFTACAGAKVLDIRVTSCPLTGIGTARVRPCIAATVNRLH